jgi:lipopolysaccharide transport system ATP-binding protein
VGAVVAVENVGKKYILGQTHTYLLSEKIENTLRSFYQMVQGKKPILNPVRNPAENEFWALQGVNVEVQEGEIVGIIGRNGAGKSTLLKILARITDPTTGRITLQGRISSLLEVGTGFHPELTGRENVFLNGAILGMSKNEIRNKFDEIVAFAEIDKFIDTPVKRYSSGMYVRLAFAVAAHLEPEILVLDEVLAVGDAQFQKKCLGKMGSVAKEGRTILFVSHNMTAVRDLCKRVVWLESGLVRDDGNAAEVVSKYLYKYSAAVHEQIWPDPKTAPGNEAVRLHVAKIMPRGDSPFINVRTPLDIEFAYWNRSPGTELNASLHLFDTEGACVFNSDSTPRTYDEGIIRETCHIPGDLLNDGEYKIMIMIVKDRSTCLYQHDDVLAFEVQDVERDSLWHGKWLGAVRPMLKWTSEFVEKGNFSASVSTE